jgi:hypothetical protein
MPVTLRKLQGGGYQVRTPNRVHAKHTTKAKAERQKRLLLAVEHGWKPTGKRSRKAMTLRSIAGG